MKKLFVIAMIALTAFAARAQNSIKVEVPNVVGLNEQFNLTFIVEGESKVTDFQWEAGDDFQLVWGPQRGSSTSISVVNGKTTKNVQNTFTYILLPKSVGKFQINRASVKIGSEQTYSNPVTVEVVSNGASQSSGGSSSSSSSGGGSAGSGSSSGQSLGDVPSEDLFMRFTLSRSSAVIGEPITATLKLYQRANISGFEDARFPSFNGFWSQEIEAPSNIEFKRESYNDKIYNTAVLRRWVLIPQQAGSLRIDPAELVCLVNVRSSSHNPTSIFDSFFDDGYRTVRKRVSTPAATVNVKALPAGAPASFGGGVGSFSINSKVSKDSLKTHEAASLIVTISGRGNVSLLEAPKISFPPDFEVYDTKITTNADKSSGGTSGSKTFEYPFIPRSHGTFVLGPVEYSYYDTNTGKYVTIGTPAMELEVAKGNSSESGGGGGVISSVERKGVRTLGEDIRHICVREPDLGNGAKFFVASWVYWILILAVALVAFCLWLALRRIAARRADVVGARTRGANKMARKRLKRAGDFLAGDLQAAFYEELHKALLGYVSDKLNMGMEELDKENIAAKLSERGVKDTITSRLTALLDECDYARYSPDSGHEAMSAQYEEAVSVISLIESGMKGKKVSVVAHSILMLLTLLCLSPSIHAQQSTRADSLWNVGVECYSEGILDVAIEAWDALSASGYEAKELYYNLGNAYFKSGNYARAVLNYERALKLDPSYADARFNLEFANSQIQDKIDPVPEILLSTWARKLCYCLSSNVWAVISLVLFAFMAVMLLVFLLAPGSGARRMGFFTAVALLVLCLCSFSFAVWQKAEFTRGNEAIVLSAVSSVKSSPSGDLAKDLFVLHEGTKVRIIDEVGDWLNIELSDGRQGWIRRGELEAI